VSNPVLGLLIYFLYYPGATIYQDGGVSEVSDRVLTNIPWSFECINNYAVDSDVTHSYGACLGFLRREAVGSVWNDIEDRCGSRSTQCCFTSAVCVSDYGTRGCKKRELSWGV
jgi:hypothetical protein